MKIKYLLVLPLFFIASVSTYANDSEGTTVKDSPIWTSDTPFTDEGEFEKSAKANTCTYKGRTYSKGSVICINKLVHKCGNHGWFMINKSCN